METIEKVNVAKIKNDIKKMSEYQRFLKNQRKTEKLVGERVMEPWKATMDHYHNRLKLRAMYYAYATLRGRNPAEIDSGNFETPHDESHFKTLVEEATKKYTKE